MTIQVRRNTKAKKRTRRHIAKKKTEKTKVVVDQATGLVEISGKAKRHLRGLGHTLDPVIAIGKDGVTEGLVDATRRALLTHELVKVRVMSEAPIDRHDAAADLAMRTHSALAQVLGRTFLLYRRHPKAPRISLPK